MRVSQQFVRAYHRNTVLMLSTALAAGIAAYLLLLLFREPSERDAADDILVFLAVTLCQGALLGLVLNRATIEEQSVKTQELVGEAIDQVLLPLRPLVFEDAQEDYSWRGLVAPAEDGDPNPEYARLIVEITTTLRHLTREIRGVCIADLEESALNDYVQDERYVLRWIVRPALDPRDRRVFDLTNISVDGQRLPIEWVTTAENHSEWRARLPRSYRVPDQGARLFMRYQVRKRIGSDKRATVRTQLFRTTFAAQFSCTVDSQIRLRSLAAYHTEVSPLALDTVASGALQDTGSGPWHVSLSYSSPLQRGSAVSFELERD